ncbi:hypothetical protein [Raoultella terrigena]|uniref:hypothetical protein n=1 Tax=Raoultella terrigena TaxID=577 RepID=UPI003F5D50F6
MVNASSSRRVGDLFEKHGGEPGHFALHGIQGFLPGQVKNEFAEQGRNGKRTAGCGHHRRTGLNKKKAGARILRYATAVRRITGDPDRVPGRNKPQRTSYFAADGAV